MEAPRRRQGELNTTFTVSDKRRRHNVHRHHTRRPGRGGGVSVRKNAFRVSRSANTAKRSSVAVRWHATIAVTPDTTSTLRASIMSGTTTRSDSTTRSRGARLYSAPDSQGHAYAGGYDSCTYTHTYVTIPQHWPNAPAMRRRSSNGLVVFASVPTSAGATSGNRRASAVFLSVTTCNSCAARTRGKGAGKRRRGVQHHDSVA